MDKFNEIRRKCGGVLSIALYSVRRRFTSPRVICLLLLNLITAAVLLPYSTLSMDVWGKLIKTLSENELGLEFQFGIPASTLRYYSPLSACVMNFLLDWGLAVFIGLLTFALNLRLHKMIGPMVCAVIIMYNLLVVNHLGGRVYHISPVWLARLSELDTTGTTFYPGPTYALCFYAVSAVIFSAAILLSVRKLPIETATEV